MTGLCGVIGDDHHVEEVAAGLEWTGEEATTRFEDARLSIAGSFTTERDADQPVSVGNDTLLWVWGSVFGVETDDSYEPRDVAADATVDYCAALYDRYGMEFVSRLNGDFVGVLYNRADGVVSVFTDRIGIRDTYYTKPDDDTFVFSTAIQSLSRHPAVTPAFDLDYVTEYFTCHFRTFGLRTPLEGTYLFPPASVTAVDVDSLARESRQYWTPRYRPSDRPFSYFVREFTRRFRDAVTERLSTQRRYGLLLSGGLDSRLVLAVVGKHQRENLTAYHMADWMSREARVAERVALTAGVEFEWLKRDPGYTERALARNPKLSNFVGTFEQAHAEGFMGEIRGDVDEMMTASFADSNFKGYSFPKYRFRVGPVGTVILPAFRPMDSIDSYVDFWLAEPPRYLDSPIDAGSLLRREIRPSNGGVEHHGVRYGSPEELFRCGMLTPRTNGSVLFMLQSLRQHLPSWSPYVDNRLVDLYLSMPTRYFARRNVIAAAIERLDPALAAIPYANSGLPARYPASAHVVGEHAVRFADRYLPIDDPPAPHMGHGPWQDHETLVRSQSFVREALDENEHIVRQLPFLDWGGVDECYRKHQAGENRHRELYGLVTLLGMPVTERIANEMV